MDSYIYEKIILYLPFSDILKCKQVSHLFNDIISEDIFWKQIYNKEFNDNKLKNISESNYYDECRKLYQITTLKKDINDNCQFIESPDDNKAINKLKKRVTKCYLKFSYQYEIILSGSPGYYYDKNIYTERCVFNFPLGKIPKSIKNLNDIESIDLSFNIITWIPNELCVLKNLTKLNMRNNCITEIPPMIKNLENLKELNISRNEIEKIPDELFLMKSLQKLDMSLNVINRIPESIKNANNLEIIDLGYNTISVIPDEVFMLENLREIKLNDNQIENFPNKIRQLKNIECINLKNNCIEDYPTIINKIKLTNKNKLEIILNIFRFEIFYDKKQSMRISLS